VQTRTCSLADVHDTSVKKMSGPKKRAKDGRWSEEEHALFLRGVSLHGRSWSKVAQVVGSRTTVQVRSHAQKYELKMGKVASASEVQEDRARPPPAPVLGAESGGHNDHPLMLPSTRGDAYNLEHGWSFSQPLESDMPSPPVDPQHEPPLLDLDLEDDPSDSPFFRTRDGGRAAFPDYFLQSSKSSFAVVDGLASGEAEISDLALWYSETKADLAGSAEFLDDEFDLKELTSLRRSSEDGTTSGDAVDDGRMSISAPPVVVGVGATEELLVDG